MLKVSPKFQVVVPKEIREALGLRAGSLVDVIAKGKVAYLVPLLTLPSLKATLKGRIGTHAIRDKRDRKL